MRIHAYTHIYIHTYIYVCIYIYTYVRIYIYICIHVYMHTYIYIIYIYISIFIYDSEVMWPSLQWSSKKRRPPPPPSLLPSPLPLFPFSCIIPHDFCSSYPEPFLTFVPRNRWHWSTARKSAFRTEATTSPAPLVSTLWSSLRTYTSCPRNPWPPLPSSAFLSRTFFCYFRYTFESGAPLHHPFTGHIQVAAVAAMKNSG